MPAGRRVCRLLASTPRVDALPVAEAGLGPRTVCVVGNEGAGVTRETMALCDALVTIPMSGACGVAKRFRCGRNPHVGNDA